MRYLRAAALASLCLTVIVALGAQVRNPPGDARLIAVFGSSVAAGTGDEAGRGGYAGRLRELLTPRGWHMMNESRPGDSTRTAVPRFANVIAAGPRYVLLGLSLGNEGIRGGASREEKDAIFKQFESGLRGFIDRGRANQMVPIVTSCYTRMDFTPIEYDYTKRMNLLINSWDVPSVNFLGAVDDGTGKWAKGFWSDSLHPNAAGHEELTLAFVPTLFDALAAGKPLPKKPTAAGAARLGGAAALVFTPGSRMHAFAFSLTVRAAGDGTVASIGGSSLTAATTMNRFAGVESMTLSPGPAFSASIGAVAGRWTYTGADRSMIASDVRADGQWHQLLVSHYTARGETLFFVDGRLAGRTPERLEPNAFRLGGSGAPRPTPAIDVKDVLVYRSALNGDEAAALASGTLLQSSLEVYAPLADAAFKDGAPVENRAQSLSVLNVSGSGIGRVDR